jgi:hypothetical protein
MTDLQLHPPPTTDQPLKKAKKDAESAAKLSERYRRSKPSSPWLCEQDLEFKAAEERRQKHFVAPCSRKRCIYVHQDQLDFQKSKEYADRVANGTIEQWGNFLKKKRGAKKPKVYIEYTNDPPNILKAIEKNNKEVEKQQKKLAAQQAKDVAQKAKEDEALRDARKRRRSRW